MLSRILFYLANYKFFPDITFVELIVDCWYGLRFDSFSIAVSNSLFILLSILPVHLFAQKFIQKTIRFIYVFMNALFLLPNCIDMAYFSFIRKRSGSDLFNQIGGQTDLMKLLPVFFVDFWWVLLVFLGIIISLVLFIRKNYFNKNSWIPLKSTKAKLRQTSIALSVVFITFLCIRGGINRNPIDIVDAANYHAPQFAPIILNTSFTIIKSIGEDIPEAYQFYKEDELKTLFNPLHQFGDSTFKKTNVVVLILESFAKEYTALGNIKSYTPFFDSLMQESFVFNNAFANGAKSIEGIPAILSSFPSLMENPIINSSFANNRQTSFASILNKEGYTTAFFHGGFNGTMNFDTYAKIAGYKHYFGKNEYNNNSDFDGFWGIWDEPFLQYAIKQMNGFQEPFHSTIFTLSSHHPYNIPEKYKNRFRKGHMENLESVGYADFCLQQFFNAAKKCAWFNNTLFIMTADHCSLSEHPFFKNTVGLKSIPIAFYTADHRFKGTYTHSFSQIDILPTALHMMGYSKPFFSLGQSFSKRNGNNCYYYENGSVYVVCDSILQVYNRDKLTAIYNFKRDSSLHHNVINFYQPNSITEQQFKAFLQTYNQTLIHNSASVE
ncbi:MAG: sulfatase-like hydrolase/transferase [Sphingobacteriaceae bacterium]|nr:sulfatase-like hydrolase/transferase [Sphingobacteriaceae bacterium]